MTKALRTLFLIAEADPFIKVGGLGDVGGSLPQELSGLGVDVRLMLPFHSAIRQQNLPLRLLDRFLIPYAGGVTEAEVLALEHQGPPVYFISGPLIPAEAPVYSSDAHADGLKYTFFSLAALELCHCIGWQPQILHANDWHTAPAVYALQFLRQSEPFFCNTASLLTVHNLPYLGVGAGEALANFGLPPATGSSLPDWAQDVPLALGLLTADHIVAVSPTYAQEILTCEFGVGLHHFLRQRADCISGILNGIDQSRWNPLTDPYIAAQFGTRNLEARLANKLALQAELSLEQSPEIPLLGMVTRLDVQKGVDLLPEALRQLTLSSSDASKPWQIVLLGMGDSRLEVDLRGIEIDFSRRARVMIRFDAALSHRIYAAADFFLLPSRYEPCGVAQMIAMRYGCVPIARAVGGLCDSIQDFDQTPDSTGFLFQEASSEALAMALGRALTIYHNRHAWRALQLHGMRRDFSWKKPAIQYLDLYHSLCGRSRI